ncbi:hypothetical protein D3C76_643450 [compost metagenome]
MWMALTRAAHSALPWVSTTPFGREVVPEVYCTYIGRSGSAVTRRRSAAGWASSSAAKDSQPAGSSAGAPASCSVQAIQRKRSRTRSRVCSRPGWVIATPASLWLR